MKMQCGLVSCRMLYDLSSCLGSPGIVWCGMSFPTSRGVSGGTRWSLRRAASCRRALCSQGFLQLSELPNVKSLRNTAEMRTVASSKLSGASPVLFWRNVLNIKLLMLTKGFGSIVESFAFIPQWSCWWDWSMYIQQMHNVRFNRSHFYFQLWE